MKWIKIRCTERAVKSKCYGLSKKKLIALGVFASGMDRRGTMSHGKSDIKLFSKVTTGNYKRITSPRKRQTKK